MALLLHPQWVPPWGSGMEKERAGDAKLGCVVGVRHPGLGAPGRASARTSLCHSRAYTGLCPGTDPLEQLRAPGMSRHNSPAGSPMGHPMAGPCSPRCFSGPGQRAAPGARQEGDVTAAERNSNQMGPRWRPGPQGGHRQEPVKGCRQEAAGRDTRGGSRRPSPGSLNCFGAGCSPTGQRGTATPQALAWASHTTWADAEATRTPLTIHLSLPPSPFPLAPWGAQSQLLLCSHGVQRPDPPLHRGLHSPVWDSPGGPCPQHSHGPSLYPLLWG